MKKQHESAEVLRWIADGEVIQFQTNLGEWEDEQAHNILLRLSRGVTEGFRIKPRTVMCNGVEVPAPETVAPADGELFYTPAPLMQDYANEDSWRNMSFDTRSLDRGVVYLRKEDAIARAKAMLITK